MKKYTCCLKESQNKRQVKAREYNSSAAKLKIYSIYQEKTQ